MKFTNITINDDLADIINVLNKSHGTVAEEYKFTKDNNPSNNAFIDDATLKAQIEKGIELYSLSINAETVGCVAIEKSSRENTLFYIEKVSILPQFRNKGCGVKLMDFAILRITELSGKTISIGLIDSNIKLKNWYSSQGFVESGTKRFDHLPFTVC